MRALVLVLSLTGCAGAAVAVIEEIAVAQKTTHRAAARDGHIAFLDGVEASTDPTRVGVDVRVVARDGSSIVDVPSAGAVDALVLLPDAVATLELTSTIADEHLVIRPFVDAPIALTHEHTPIALAPTERGLLWIESLVTGIADDETIVDLVLIESDARGAILSRTAVALDGGVRVPAALLAPFPRTFALDVSGDEVRLGWASLLCGGGSSVLSVSRATGVARIAWHGAVAATGPVSGSTCECAGGSENVTEVGEALAVVAGDLVVVGSVYQCASLVASGGFIMRGGTTTRVDRPLRHLATDGASVLTSDGRSILRISGSALEELAPRPTDPVTGLALDAGELFVTTVEAVLARPL